jgi:NADH:ubiquinone oxidoreductase subunit 2 (subunit N)
MLFFILYSLVSAIYYLRIIKQIFFLQYINNNNKFYFIINFYIIILINFFLLFSIFSFYSTTIVFNIATY